MPITATTRTYSIHDDEYHFALNDTAAAIADSKRAPSWPQRDPGDEPPLTAALNDLETMMRQFVATPTEPRLRALMVAIEKVHDAIQEHEDADRSPYDSDED